MRHAGLLSHGRRLAVAVVAHLASMFGARMYGRRMFGKRMFG